MEKKNLRLFHIFITLGFGLYFAILFGERLTALILSVEQGGAISLRSGSFFGVASYIVTLASLVGATPLFVMWFVPLVKYVFKKSFEEEPNYFRVILASMIFLVSGMMHTGFTLAAIQFVAYGFLILSMILVTIRHCLEKKENTFTGVVSLVYLILFSMAIPVCYPMVRNDVVNVFYYIAEFAAVFALIPLFTLMLLQLFDQGKIAFSPIPVMAMALLDGLIIGLKWSEEINWFLLIFASLTLAFYLAMGLLARKKAGR